MTWRYRFAVIAAALALGASRHNPAPAAQRSYAIFSALAGSLGWNPEGLVEHLKNMPRELAGIAEDDPKVLASFETFLVALRGPR